MKKLLATLLVAAMLISCMSLVTFAAQSTIYTDSVFGSASLFQYTEEDDDGDITYTLNPLGAAYGAAIDTHSIDRTNNASIAYAMYRARNPFTQVARATALNTLAANAPYKFTEGELVALPIYSSIPVTNCTIVVTWDSDVLTPVGKSGFANFAVDTRMANLSNADGLSGLIGVCYFTVNSGLTGDVNGEATTNISFTVNTAKSKVGNEESATGNNSIAINLTGLTPGAPAAKEDITAAEMPVAEVPAFTADASADASWITTELEKGESSQIVKGDDQDVDLSGSYTAAFGNTAAYSAYNTPDKYGIALYADGKLKGYYEAKKIIEGKFGILFFGLKDGVEYTMKNYVQYGEEAPIVAE